MLNLVLCGISGILLGILFSLERSSPIRSKFDYDEKLLEMVIRNDILLKDALEKITETNAKVEHTLARIIEENANAEVKLNDAIHTLEVKGKDLDTKVEAFINSATRIVSVTIEEMKVYLKSIVSQIDTELKAKTQNVEDFVDSAYQKLHRNVTDMTSVVLSLVEKTASELDIIKAQSVVPLVSFQAVLDSNVIRRYKTNDNVVFQKVMVNDGGGYDADTGNFTAPVAGVYIFTVQYCPYENSKAGFEIVQEGIPLQRSAHASRSWSADCVNMQVVAKVAKGAKVWVRATADAIWIYPENIRWNSFSGLLVHAQIEKH